MQEFCSFGTRDCFGADVLGFKRPTRVNTLRHHPKYKSTLQIPTLSKRIKEALKHHSNIFEPPYDQCFVASLCPQVQKQQKPKGKGKGKGKGGPHLAMAVRRAEQSTKRAVHDAFGEFWWLLSVAIAI